MIGNYLEKIRENLSNITKTTKSKDKVKTKQRNMTTKITTKKFHLVNKYANYPTWDEKQNVH